MRAALLSIFTLMAAGTLEAQEAQDRADDRALELALSDETVQLRYLTDTDIAGQEDAQMSYGFFLSEERDVVGSAGLLIGTDLNLGPLEIDFGPQAYAALLSEENNDVFTLAFGVQARFDVVPSRAIAVVGSAFWAPDVLTFGSADNLTDFMARAEMQLTDRLLGFAGYRWFELNLLMRQERKLQNEIFAGIRWQL